MVPEEKEGRPFKRWRYDSVEIVCNLQHRLALGVQSFGIVWLIARKATLTLNTAIFYTKQTSKIKKYMSKI